MWEKVRRTIANFATVTLGLDVGKTTLEEKKDKDGVDTVKVTIVLYGTKEALAEAALRLGELSSVESSVKLFRAEESLDVEEVAEAIQEDE